jgi:preprotein translocase subunit SecG
MGGENPSYTHPDWWAVELILSEDWESRPEARQLIVALVEAAGDDRDMLAVIGAGPLENLLLSDDTAVDWLEARLPDSERLRLALENSHVAHALPTDAIERLEVAGGLTLQRPNEVRSTCDADGNDVGADRQRDAQTTHLDEASDTPSPPGAATEHNSSCSSPTACRRGRAVATVRGLRPPRSARSGHLEPRRLRQVQMTRRTTRTPRARLNAKHQLKASEERRDLATPCVGRATFFTNRLRGGHSAVLTAVVVVIHVIVSLLLVLLILLHSGRGGGLSDMFGGAMGNAAAGSTVIDRNLDRITVATAVIWAFTTLMLAIRLQ